MVGARLHGILEISAGRPLSVGVSILVFEVARDGEKPFCYYVPLSVGGTYLLLGVAGCRSRLPLRLGLHPLRARYRQRSALYLLGPLSLGCMPEWLRLVPFALALSFAGDPDFLEFLSSRRDVAESGY